MLDVLVVDDDDVVRECVASAIGHAGHHVVEAGDGAEALRLIASKAFDLAVCDVQMPHVDGLTVFRRLRRESPATAVVMMTSFGTVADVVAAFQGGAVDYVTKPFDTDDFVHRIVGPIAERNSAAKALDAARTSAAARNAGAAVVGDSLAIRQLVRLAGIVGATDASVLITGASGTGKKLLARTLHAGSPRREGPLVIMPCATLPQLISESEMLEAAALRARGSRDEWFAAAEGGTLVLDRIDVLPEQTQSVLLRLANDPVVRARRDKESRRIGVRVVATSELSPSALSERGSVAPHLLQRLATAHLAVPPLSDRADDIYMLISHFLRMHAAPSEQAVGISPDAVRALVAHTYTGNVTELAWVVQYALAAAGGREIEKRHLPAPFNRSLTLSAGR